MSGKSHIYVLTRPDAAAMCCFRMVLLVAHQNNFVGGKGIPLSALLVIIVVVIVAAVYTALI